MNRPDSDSDPRSDGEPLFEWVCRQGDVEKSVRGMDGDALRALAAYLHFLPDGGVPLLVTGLVHAVAAERYLKGGNQ
jgi:hypothetical protein